MVSYDPSVINTFAQKLYDRASTITVAYIAIGIAVGAGIGKFSFDTVGMVVVAVFAGVIGYFIGSQRAFLLRLQAQTALCQVQIEYNTQSIFVLNNSLKSGAEFHDLSPSSRLNTERVTSMSETGSQKPIDSPTGRWICHSCTGKNESGDSDCRYCKALRTA